MSCDVQLGCIHTNTECSVQQTRWTPIHWFVAVYYCYLDGCLDDSSEVSELRMNICGRYKCCVWLWINQCMLVGPWEGTFSKWLGILFKWQGNLSESLSHFGHASTIVTRHIGWRYHVATHFCPWLVTGQFCKIGQVLRSNCQHILSATTKQMPSLQPVMQQIMKALEDKCKHRNYKGRCLIVEHFWTSNKVKYLVFVTEPTEHSHDWDNRHCD